MREFWLLCRLQDWKNGGNFVDLVNKKMLRTLYVLPIFPVSSDNLTYKINLNQPKDGFRTLYFTRYTRRGCTSVFFGGDAEKSLKMLYLKIWVKYDVMRVYRERERERVGCVCVLKFERPCTLAALLRRSMSIYIWELSKRSMKGVSFA